MGSMSREDIYERTSEGRKEERGTRNKISSDLDRDSCAISKSLRRLEKSTGSKTQGSQNTSDPIAFYWIHPEICGSRDSTSVAAPRFRATP